MKLLFLVTLLGLFGQGCVNKGQKRKNEWSLIDTCKDKSLSFRAGTCVREGDQCPSDRIEPDQSCKQVPCSPGLYYDGTYCVVSPGTRVSVAPVTASFMDRCLGTLTNDQKYSFSAILALAEKDQTLEYISKSTWETRCGAAFGSLSKMKEARLEIPYGELRDLTPLAAFDDLPEIERIVIDVSKVSVMTCPLQDPARCLFKAW